MALLLAPATVLTLIISDVIGNDISAVGSGPTAPDPTTYRDAKEVVDGYDLRSKIPARIRKVIDEGVRGQIPDTPKAGDAVFRKVRNIVIGNNLLSCKAAAVHMDNLGYESRVLTTHMVGESRDLGGFLGSILTDIRENGLPIPSPVALTVGGETTVTIRGKGKGGRNQELVLASALAIDGLRNVVLVSLATDGVDGPTDAAGAIADGTTVTRGFKARMKAEEYLGNNDSYSYFRRLGDLVRTGPTGTNVNDLTIVAAR